MGKNISALKGAWLLVLVGELTSLSTPQKTGILIPIPLAYWSITDNDPNTQRVPNTHQFIVFFNNSSKSFGGMKRLVIVAKMRFGN